MNLLMFSNSLVLIDEIGAGTDPEEGSALALSIIKRLLEKSCFGIITTHYSKLKEFAMDDGRIVNACMEFDAKTLNPNEVQQIVSTARILIKKLLVLFYCYFFSQKRVINCSYESIFRNFLAVYLLRRLLWHRAFSTVGSLLF